MEELARYEICPRLNLVDLQRLASTNRRMRQECQGEIEEIKYDMAMMLTGSLERRFKLACAKDITLSIKSYVLIDEGDALWEELADERIESELEVRIGIKQNIDIDALVKQGPLGEITPYLRDPEVTIKSNENSLVIYDINNVKYPLSYGISERYEGSMERVVKDVFSFLGRLPCFQTARRDPKFLAYKEEVKDVDTINKVVRRMIRIFDGIR